MNSNYYTDKVKQSIEDSLKDAQYLRLVSNADNLSYQWTVKELNQLIELRQFYWNKCDVYRYRRLFNLIQEIAG